MTNQRKSDYPIDEMFLNRSSLGAFTEQPITQQELLAMMEAARWVGDNVCWWPGQESNLRPSP